MPTAVKQTLDPKLLVSKGLDASNFQSKAPVKAGSLLGYLEKTGQIKTPGVQSVIKPVQEIMKPMSQELPVAPASRSLPNGQPIIAGNVTPQSLQAKATSESLGQLDEEEKAFLIKAKNAGFSKQEAIDSIQRRRDDRKMQSGRYNSNLFAGAADYYQNDVMGAIKSSDNILVNNPITRSLAGVGAMGFKGLRDVTQGGGELLDKGLAQVGLGDKKYKGSTVGENLYDIGQGAVNTLATAYAPVAVTTIGAGIQALPENAQKAVGEIMGDVGGFISKAPGLKQWRDSLPIDRRQEFDNEVAGAAIGLLTGLKGKKNIIKDPKLFLKQNLNPVNIAKNFQENVLNLPANAVGTAKAIPGQLVKVGDKIKNIETPKGVKKAINQSIEQLQGISKAQKQGLENNPFTTEYLPQVLKKIDNGDVPTNLKDLQEPYLRETVNKIDKLLDERKSIIGEEGQAYKLLRSDPTIIDTKSMVREMNGVLKGTDYNIRSFLNKVDQGNLLGTREILKGESLTSTIHDVRKSIDRLMEKAKANKDSGEYQVLQKMRGIVDNQLKSNPQWRQADEIFKQEIDIIKEIEEGITYREARRQGQFRDNIDNIIANINQPAKAQLKERLSKYMPDLAERIEVISQIPQIAKAYTSVPTGPIARTIGAAAGGAIGGASMGLPGAIVGIVGGFFTDIALTSARRKAIVEAVNKVGPKATQRLSNLIDEIKNLEEVDSNRIKQIKSHVDEISSRVNDPELKAQMKKITEDKIRQKIKTRSIVPLKEGQLKNNPATAMIYPKKPVVNVIEKGVAKQPGTTKVNPKAIIKKSEIVKGGKKPVKTVPKTTETKIEPKKATVYQEPQKVNPKAKVPLAKKEKGSIMDGMKTSKDIKLYRGGNSEGKYMSTSKSIAESYASVRGGSVKEYVLPKGSKIIDYDDVPGIKYKGINDYDVEKIAKKENKNVLDFMNDNVEKDFSIAEEYARSKGYDAIRYPTEGEIRIINPKKLSPKSDTINPKAKVVSKELQPLYDEARKYKSADDFIRSKKNFDIDNYEILSSLVKQNNAGQKFKVSDIFPGDEMKKIFGEKHNADIVVIDKSHQVLKGVGETKTMARINEKSPNTIFIRGGSEINIDTILEEIGHLKRMEKGRMGEKSFETFNNVGEDYKRYNIDEQFGEKFVKNIYKKYISTDITDRINGNKKNQLRKIREEAKK